MENKKRYGSIDIIRGFSILLMIGYHAMYDAKMFFNTQILFFNIDSPIFAVLQPFFAGVFITVSGLCTGFSKSNKMRGLKLILVAYLLTVVTFFFGNGSEIVFGILHCLGFCMLIYGLLEKQVKKISVRVQLILFAALTAISAPFSYRLVKIPHLYMLGLYDANFVSADYFPLLPWIFLFFFGAALSAAFKEGKFPKIFYTAHCAPLEWVGRNSLLVYLFHQPVLYVIFTVIQALSR